MPVEPLIAELTAAQKAQAARAGIPQSRNAQTQAPQIQVPPVRSPQSPVPQAPPVVQPAQIKPPQTASPQSAYSQREYSQTESPRTDYVKPEYVKPDYAQSRSPQVARDYPRESREEPYVPEPFHGQRTPVPVTGPSFLGLSESNNNEERFEYLLEDEPHPGRLRTLIGAVVLIALAAGGFFYWRNYGFPLLSHSSTQAAATGPVSPAENGGLSSAAMPPEEIRKTPQKSDAPETAPPVDTNTISSKAEADLKASEPPSKKIIEPLPSPSSVQKPAASVAPPPVAATPPAPAPQPKAVQSAKLSQPDLPKPRTTRPLPVAPTTPDPAQESLFLQGQRYLYGGNGTPANCGRAEQYLNASANNNNSKAQATLGTMYATGHCVRRDLPLAYRWFARALHGDPRNTRLERDVEIMWNQMSPQERNTALRNN